MPTYSHLKYHRVGYPLEYMTKKNKVVYHEVISFRFEEDSWQVRSYYLVKDDKGEEKMVDAETFREM